MPAKLHGKSVVPLLKGEKTPWRKAFLIEYFSDTVFPRMHKMGYQAVRTELEIYSLHRPARNGRAL